MKLNRWEDTPSRTTRSTRSKPANNGRATANSSTTSTRARTSKSGFGDNPPIWMKIIYRNGASNEFYGDQIDAGNPVIAALGTIRTTRRFWRLNPDRLPGISIDRNTYSTDEELISAANSLGYRSSDAVEIGRILGCVAEYFVTGEDGEPAVDDRGNWIPASPDVRDPYVPGTYYAPGTYRPPYTPPYYTGPAAAPASDPAAAPATDPTT